MGTPNDVLRIAAGEIGYYAPDDPQPGSKYGRWMADVTGESWLAGPSTEVWWCMIFVSWVFAQAGVDFPGAPSYNTDSTLAAARRVGRVTDAGHAGPGDIVVFDWDFSSAATDHVGIVERNCGTYLQTIEGNTSGSANGKQSNGNGVWRRTRDYSVVAGVVSPYWDGPSSAAPVHASLAVDGWWGPATVRALQAALGTDRDGVVSNQDSRDMSAIGGVPSTAWQVGRGGSDVIAALQSKVGVEADRYFGPNTCRALQRYLGTEQDGVLSRPSACVREMQRRLNAGTF